MATVEGPRREPNWRELDDATLLIYLRQALRTTEGPPPQVIELAKASFGLRNIDAELATLVADSLDEATGPRVRSLRAPRMLSFEAPGLTVEIELTPTGAGWRLIGQLDPPGPARIRLRGVIATSPTGVPGVGEAEADRLGRFALDVGEAGPVSLLCQRQGERPVVTTWLLIG